MELPLKPRQLHPASKKVSHTNNNSGVTGGKKNKATNGLAAAARAEAQKDARAQTKKNMMILVLLPNGKRKFIRKEN